LNFAASAAKCAGVLRTDIVVSAHGCALAGEVSPAGVFCV